MSKSRGTKQCGPAAEGSTSEQVPRPGVRIVPSSRSEGEDRRKEDPAGSSSERWGNPSPTKSAKLLVPAMGNHGAIDGVGASAKTVRNIKEHGLKQHGV